MHLLQVAPYSLLSHLCIPGPTAAPAVVKELAAGAGISPVRVPTWGRQQEQERESSCALCPEVSQEMLSRGGVGAAHLAFQADFMFRSGRGELESRLQVTPVS